MKLSKQQATWLQAGIGVALIAGVVVLSTCLHGRLPNPQDVTVNWSKFVAAQDAYEKAAQVCLDCSEELERGGLGGGLVSVHPCLLECMRLSEEAAKKADEFAGAVVDAGGE